MKMDHLFAEPRRRKVLRGMASYPLQASPVIQIAKRFEAHLLSVLKLRGALAFLSESA
jgi:hypothetical protein